MANFGTERVYQSFEPAIRWIYEPDADILIADLPGFKQEQLQVSITTLRKLTISGERPTGGNKWIRFHQEIQVPLTVNIDSLSATFKDNKLYVRVPKIKTDISRIKPPPPIMKPHDQHETTKQDQGSKALVEKPTSGKTDQHETKQGQGSKALVEKPSSGKTDQHETTKQGQGSKALVEKPSNGKTDQHETKQGQGSKALVEKHDDAQKETKQELICEPKGPLTSKDEEKDEVGAKWSDKYKEATGNVVKEAKNKRQLLCNLAVSISLLLLILLYARNAVRSSLLWKTGE